MNGPTDEPAGEPAARAWCRFVISFLGNCMVDPHRGFEQKLGGEADAAAGPSLAGFMERLAAWADSDLIGAAQRARLEQALAAAGLPSVRAVRGEPALRAALLRGPPAEAADRARLRRALEDPGWGTPGDRALARRALGE